MVWMFLLVGWCAVRVFGRRGRVQEKTRENGVMNLFLWKLNGSSHSLDVENADHRWHKVFESSIAGVDIPS